MQTTMQSLHPKMLLTLIFGMLVAAAPAAAAWTAIFTDGGQPQWTQLYKLVGQPCNTVTRSGKTLRVTSCGLTGPGSRAAMLWPRLKVDGKIKVELDFIQHVSLSPLESTSALIVLASGDDTAGYPFDVTTWGPQCCSGTSTYPHHMYGVQINFAYKNDPRGTSTIRLRGLKGAAADYEELGASPPQYEFIDGRKYRMTVIRSGATLRIAVLDTVTSVKRSFSVTHPYIGTLNDGWIGFRQRPGRSSTLGNVKISDDN